MTLGDQSQSCNPLCYHLLQTEEELELVNEVIFRHVSQSHESMIIGCPHIISMNIVLHKSLSLLLVLVHWHNKIVNSLWF